MNADRVGTKRRGHRLLRSGLTGSVYVVTRWIDYHDGTIEAITKYDVTDDYRALTAETPSAP